MSKTEIKLSGTGVTPAPVKANVRNLVDVKGKRVLVRADLNVPQEKDGSISDETRIVESMATIRFLLDKGARVVLCSHLGRPKGKDPKFTLAPVFKRLQELLPKNKVFFVEDCIGKKVEDAAKALKDGELLLIENLRFYDEEKNNDLEFAKKLSQLGTYFVNDAFGAAHRAHASTQGVTNYLPSVAGFLMEKEIKILGEVISAPRRPLTVIIGGKKVSDKMGVINALMGLANTILIGGGMSYTFAKAFGGEVGNSIVDEASLEYCKEVVATAKAKGITLAYAVDSIVADKFAPDAHTMQAPTNKIPTGWEGLDIGPKTIEEFKKLIAKSGTVLWNGPMGVSEFEIFANGTREVAKAIIDSGAVSIIGGGDSASAAVRFGLADKFTHISTGGGATLEFLEGKELPGYASLLGNEAIIK